METISPKLTLLDRSDWGARTDIGRLGWQVMDDRRLEMIHHHTVIIDNDATPNLWENIHEVKAKMRQLQTIRPDLGLDVPYNYVAFLMANGTIYLCEGRGASRTGAHTHGHNTSGMAIAIEGNLEDYYTDLAPYVEPLSHAWGWLKYDMGLMKLGTVVPDDQRDIYGHRDFYATACPGKWLFQKLEEIEAVKWEPPTVEPPPVEDDRMKLFLIHLPIGDFYYVCDATERSHVFNMTTAAGRLRLGLIAPGLTELEPGDDLDIVMDLRNAAPIL